MRAFTRPKIVVSKCLGFEACRHNGAQINEEIMPMLERYVDFFPVCPEVEIGLGTPREAIRLVVNGDEDQLIQSKSNSDLTTAMNQFADRFLTEIEEIDGFILKNRSPSCGVTDAKVYSGVEKAPVVRTGSGTFTKKVVKFFPETALEDEGRLKNFMIREHFLHLLDQLREKKMPLSSILGVLRSWCYRFENKYLLQQSYFEPYPEGLVAISDSGKGRELS